MTDKMITGVVVDDVSVQGDLETFAVTHDLLTRVEPKYVASQKALLAIGSLLIIVGAVMLLLPLLNVEIISLPVLLWVGVLALGVVFLIVFFLRTPKHIKTVKKVYWPIAVVPVPSTEVEMAVAVDATNKVWNGDFLVPVTHNREIDSVLGTIPHGIFDHQVEMQALARMQSLQELTIPERYRGPVAEDASFPQVLVYAQAGRPLPEAIFANQGWAQSEAVGKRLSELRVLAKMHNEFSAFSIEHLDTRVGACLQDLENMYRAEIEHMTAYMANYMTLSEPLPEFFDPFIINFRSEVQQDLVMLDRFSERQMVMTQDRVENDQEFARLLLEHLVQELQVEKSKVVHNTRLRESHMTSVDQLIQKVRSAIEVCNQVGGNSETTVIRSQVAMADDAIDLPEMLIEATQDGQGLGRFILNNGGRSISPELFSFVPAPLTLVKLDDTIDIDQPSIPPRDPHTESQLRRYRNLAEALHRSLLEMQARLDVCDKDLGQLGQGVHQTTTAVMDRIRSVISAGQRSLEMTDLMNQEDARRIRSSLDEVEQSQGFVAQVLLDTQHLLLEETVRHLRPLAERGQTWERERYRLVAALREAQDGYSQFDKALQDRTFRTSEPGICHVPFWLFQYQEGKELHSKVYPLSTLTQKGALRVKFSQLDLPAEKVLSLMAVPPTGIDKELFADLHRSHKAVKERCEIGSLSAYIVKRGVSRLAQ